MTYALFSLVQWSKPILQHLLLRYVSYCARTIQMKVKCDLEIREIIGARLMTAMITIYKVVKEEDAALRLSQAP